MQPFHASSSESSRTWLEATTCSTLHTLEDSQPQVHQPLVGPIMKHPLQDKDLQKAIQQFLTQKHSCANGHENMTNLLQAMTTMTTSPTWACFGKSSAIPGLKKSPSCNQRSSLDRWKIPWTFAPCLFDLRHGLWSHTSCREQPAKCLVRHPNQPPGRSDLS